MKITGIRKTFYRIVLNFFAEFWKLKWKLYIFLLQKDDFLLSFGKYRWIAVGALFWQWADKHFCLQVSG